jgi:cell pole-organizing protein PopZ
MGMKMAQPNVAREPSMDEILASIRRIIESNEPLAGGPAAFAPIAPEDDADAGDDSFDADVIVADLSADRPSFDRSPFDRAFFDRSPIDRPVEAVPAQPPAIEPETRTAQPAMSLADVAARVRAASERKGMLLREQAGRPAPEAESDVQQAENPFAASPAAASPAATEVAREPTPSPLSIVEPAQQPPPLQPVSSADAASRGSLISPDIGAKVAHSFGALAEAVEAGPRRSFDEIAEEMLRPMLQEWLDDNLPTLVERLVREEIERVARGPRR